MKQKEILFFQFISFFFFLFLYVCKNILYSCPKSKKGRNGRQRQFSFTLSHSFVLSSRYIVLVRNCVYSSHVLKQKIKWKNKPKWLSDFTKEFLFPLQKNKQRTKELVKINYYNLTKSVSINYGSLTVRETSR